MGKKGRKVKWKNLPSTFRTAVIGALIFLAAGIGLIIYGRICGIGSDDIHTVQATIVSLEKVDRPLSEAQQEKLLEDGASEESVLYEYEVGYSCEIDGKEYRHTARKHLDKGKSLSEGDTESLKYAVVNGKTVFDPETRSSYGVFGAAFIVAGLLAGIAAYVLRPQNTKKQHT